MEITTAPHRPAPTPWGRLLALVVIIAPVSILVLLPIGLGLQRYVMTGDSMDSGAEGGIPEGSVVFEREVPVGDLRVGDVITYRPPRSAGVDGVVTHRIVDIGPNGIVTKGDAQSARDPWVLRPQEPTLPRVVFTLPWVGYAYLVVLHPYTWQLVVGSAVLLLVLVGSEVRRRRRLASAASPDSSEASGGHPEPARTGPRGGTSGGKSEY